VYQVTPRFNSLKLKRCITEFEGQESRSGLARSHDPGSHEFAVKLLTGLQSSEDLTVHRGFTSKMVHSQGYLSVLIIWHLAIPKASNPRESDPRQAKNHSEWCTILVR